MRGREDFLSILAASQAGDATAKQRLFEAVHAEMSTIAGYLLKGERRVSLRTGDLVNEAAMTFLQAPNLKANDRAHFLAIVTKVMRQILVDAARRRLSNKRHKIAVTLTPDVAVGESHDIDVFALERALEQLQAIDPQRCDLVVMRYYGGMSISEIAKVQNISESTAKRSWRAARAWLRKTIEDDNDT